MVSEVHSKGTRAQPHRRVGASSADVERPHILPQFWSLLWTSLEHVTQDCRWQRHLARRHLLNFPASTLSTQCETAHVRGIHTPPRLGRCCLGSSSKPSQVEQQRLQRGGNTHAQPHKQKRHEAASSPSTEAAPETCDGLKHFLPSFAILFAMPCIFQSCLNG